MPAEATAPPQAVHADELQPPSPPERAAPRIEPSPLGNREVHHGLYVGVTMGFAHVAAWGTGPSGSASVSGLGASLRLALGGTIAPGLALAAVVEVQSATGKNFSGGPSVTVTRTRMVDGMAQTMTSTSSQGGPGSVVLGALVDWYPKPDDGWHVGGALGLGGLAVDDEWKTITGTSVAVSVFGGYQWWLGRGWSLGIGADLLFIPTVTLNEDTNVDSGYRMRSLSGGLEGTLLYY